MKMAFLLCVLAFGFEMASAQTDTGGLMAAAGDVSKCADIGAIRSVEKIVEEWKTGYNTGNAAKVAALYTEDADYLTQHFAAGIVHGRASIQAYVQRGVDAGYRIDSLRIISVGCSGGLMYTVARYDATNAGQKVFGVNLVVLRRSGSGWRIVAHEAAVPDPSTAIQHLDIPNSR